MFGGSNILIGVGSLVWLEDALACFQPYLMLLPLPLPDLTPPVLERMIFDFGA